MQPKPILIAALILTIAILACANPVGTPAQPPSVETVVAMTFQALTGTAPETGVTPPPSTSDLLPHSLYFSNTDAAAHVQIYRLARDGKTQTQLTFEPADVGNFDVSPTTGQIAYTSNNQLLLINGDGSGRQVLLDGGPVDQNSPFLNEVGSPTWSPNGETIAYGHGGLNFYAVASGVSNLVLENKLENPSGNFVFPGELYAPVRFSPDGTKLLIQMSYMEGGAYAIYIPSSKALIRLSDTSACCGANWAPDSNSFFAALPTTGMFSSGLWHIDANNGQVTTLIPGDAGNNNWNFADAPQVSPDGQLYFFFANTPLTDEFMVGAPLQLVRSGLDGVTGRTVVLPDTFKYINGWLWSPDAKFVLLVLGQNEHSYSGGQVKMIYTDGTSSVDLLSFANGRLVWGP